MKDKLYKTNHKTMYYVAKNTLLSFSIFLGAAVAVAIPTTINLLTTEPTKIKAEENSSSEVTNNEEEINLLSYEESVQQA